MLNTYHAGNSSTKNNLNINAVSGAIVKNHRKSWFQRFHLESATAKRLLVEGGHKHNSFSDAVKKDVVVLQMVICGNMEVIAECIYKDDFESEEEQRNV